MTFERIPEAKIKLELKKHYDSAKAVMGNAQRGLRDLPEGRVNSALMSKTPSLFPTLNNEMEI